MNDLGNTVRLIDRRCKIRALLALSLLILVLLKPAAATEEEPQCDALYLTSAGEQVDATYSAIRYSEDNIGAVGIAVYPGRDVAKLSPHLVGLLLVRRFKRHDLAAKCFVDKPQNKPHTLVSYKVNGLSWREGASVMEISEAQRESIIKDVVAEANLVRKLYIPE